jgi:hypothetical protein
MPATFVLRLGTGHARDAARGQTFGAVSRQAIRRASDGRR